MLAIPIRAILRGGCARTTDKLFDHLDFNYAFRAFMDNLQGVSIYAIAKGMRDVGVKDNEVLVFSELMDAKSLFLTANADTVYFMGVHRPQQGTHGARDAAQGARHARRRLVALGHRLRRCPVPIAARAAST